MWLRSVSLKKRRAPEVLFAFDAHDNRAASSAMADAKSRGIEVVKLCRNKPLSDAHRSSIMALLKDGADLNVRYGPGNTALHFAAEKGHADVVKELLAKGADPICPNDEGKTPIDFARMTGNSEIAKILETSKKKIMLQTASPQSSSSSNITATSGKAQPNAEASPPAALQEPEPVQHAPDAATQPKVLSPAERKALENIITTTASSSLLPPNVTSIGYAGEFLDGQRHGTGVQRWSDGHVYSGGWKRDKKHGLGTYRFSSAAGDRLDDICDWYEGLWQDGSMHGRGVYHHKSGDVYEGEFVDNEMSGSGIYTTADGNKIQGMFSAGNFVGDGQDE